MLFRPKHIALLGAVVPFLLLGSQTVALGATDPCYATYAFTQACSANETEVCGGYIEINNPVLSGVFNIDGNTATAEIMANESLTTYNLDGNDYVYVNWLNPYSYSVTYSGSIIIIYAC
jgi:hypothetical protein